MNHHRSRPVRASSLVALLLTALLLAAARVPAAQPIYRWTTLAGRASLGSEDGNRTEARFNNPHAVAFDALGNLYIADTGNHAIRRITPAGVVSTFAGKAGEPGAIDGVGADARFRSPQGLAVDRNGNVYVADTGNHTLRRITPAGAVETIAGTAGQAGTADGAATAARFDSPDRLAVDQQGNVYLSNHGIRKISGSSVTTLSIPAQATDVDGNRLSVLTDRCPALDNDGNLYFSTINLDSNFLRSRAEQYLKVQPSGANSVVRSSYYGTDNSGSFYAWRFHEDTLFNDYAGRLFVAIEFRANIYPRPFRIVRMQPDGTLLTSNMLEVRSHLGQPVRPLGVAQDAAGTWYYTRPTDSAIHSSDGVYAGTTRAADAVDGQGPAARFASATHLAVDRSANVWVAESVTRYQDTQIDPKFSFSTRVRKVTSTGIVSTPTQPASWSSFSGDYYHYPSGISVDQSGTVTLARLENFLSLDFRVNQLFADGTWSEMEAPSGYVDDPVGDNVGNLYVLNYTNIFGWNPPPAYDRIARRESNGTWSTLAGGPSNEILDGTGTAARFKSPSNLTLDRANNLYLVDRADADAFYLRKITGAGVVTTVSGKLSQAPTGLAVGQTGFFYVSYSGSNTITRLSADGTETVIGGTRDVAGSRDGTAALFTSPGRLVVDAQENLYVIDGAGTTVRKGEFLGYAPEITTQPQSTTVTSGGNATFSVTVASETTAPTYQWQLNGTAIAGATSASLAISSARTADAGDYTVVVSNDAGSVTSNRATLTVTSAPPPSSGGGSSGGGGAPSAWFGLATAVLVLLRRRFAARSRSSMNSERFCRITPHLRLRTDGSQMKRYSVLGSHLLVGIICGALTYAPRSAAADYYFTHLAGPLGGPGNADGPVTRARFNAPNSLALDAQGNLIVLDAGNRTVRKITPHGVVTTVRPDGQFAIWFSGPSGVAIDANGTIYVADANQQIFKVASNGAKSAWAGVTYYPVYDRNREIGGHWDGPKSGAQFFRPSAMAFDRAGNLYVADTGNHVIRKITPDGIVSTVAGAPRQSGNADGVGASARFVSPRSIVVDPAGTLYVADFGSIRKITPEGTVTTLAGVADQSGSVDGNGSAARFYRPAIALDADGTIFVADSGNHTIRRVTPSGEVTTLAGLAGQPENFEGIGAQAHFANPSAIVIDARGMLLVADTDNDCIRQVAPDGTVTTFAGAAGGVGRTDGQGAAVRFYEPWGLALDDLGNLYVADRRNSLIRKVSPSGQVSTFAGGGQMFGAADGPLGKAAFFEPSDVAVDRERNVYVSDAGNNLIRKVAPDGTVTTLAGRARFYGSKDGPGSEATFAYPLGVAVDSSGTIFVADAGNKKIRRISPQGIVSTFELRGDLSSFVAPHGIAIDHDGTLFVADRNSHVIHRISPDGTVTIVAGKPFDGGFVDGRDSAARFFGPTDVAIDPTGNLIVADSSNHAMRLITPNGEVSTIGGAPGIYGSADGLTASAHFLMPLGLAIDRYGQIYVGEALNNSIRKAQKAGAPQILTQPHSKSALIGSSTSLSVEAAAVPTPTFQWFFNGNAIGGANGSTLSLSVVTSANAGDYTVVIANDLGSVTSNKATLTVTTAPTSPSASSGGSGGGAPSVWFVAIAIAMLRRAHRNT